jgi:hypothetical protein
VRTDNPSRTRTSDPSYAKLVLGGHSKHGGRVHRCLRPSTHASDEGRDAVCPKIGAHPRGTLGGRWSRDQVNGIADGQVVKAEGQLAQQVAERGVGTLGLGRGGLGRGGRGGRTCQTVPVAMQVVPALPQCQCQCQPLPGAPCPRRLCRRQRQTIRPAVSKELATTNQSHHSW